ncbi:MAG: UDP-N-acetylmuramate dehydrogenase [Proteobacteria bacterium]|nr:UDP-N-acetylmuramate dehydrogenase [Pseudomonadota bacterium]MDA1323365.1 UDP-N-acetylmuramate dehydrogenase [Pseudomonadota bacterium]
MTARQTRHLIDRLPPVRGRLTANAAISRYTWFRVGGPAEILFEPADRDDLAAFLAEKPGDTAITIIGVGSNLLVRDGGIPGVTIKLGRAFSRIEILGDSVTAGAGAIDVTLSRTARDSGLGGLEFLSGIPGTIGGAVRMNAGAYGREIKDVLTEIEAISADGEIHRVRTDALGFSYRHCDAPDDWIITQAVMKGAVEAPDLIAARMAEIEEAREDSQPIRTRTGGSTFKNPPDTKAWKLIEAAGCRGLRRGSAQVSELHCNFLINTGDATAADLEGLGEDVRRRVFEKSGVTLDWEIKRVGIALTKPKAVTS